MLGNFNAQVLTDFITVKVMLYLQLICASRWRAVFPLIHLIVSFYLSLLRGDISLLKPQEFEISYILKSRKYIESRNEDAIHEYRRRFNPSHHPSRYALARFASKFDLGRSIPNTLVASHPKPFGLFPSFIAFGHLFVNVFNMYFQPKFQVYMT